MSKKQMGNSSMIGRLALAALAQWLLAACGDDAMMDDEGGGRRGDAAAPDVADSGDDVAEPESGGRGSSRPDTGGSGGSSGSSASSGGSGGDSEPPATGGGGSAEPYIPKDCPALAVNEVPGTLSCTGLYMDIEAKELAPGLRYFKPAHQLWSDGAQKKRWIYLPPGGQIDASVPNDWKFPVGTKLFKEFAWNGRRVETRLFMKVAENRWLKAPYRWNKAETEAERFAGGDIDVDGDSYHIPSAKECDQCHKGRADRALGFEQALLGLEGAEGVTLADLVDEGLMTSAPKKTALEIGDDGTGKAAPALAWLHVNCGVSCHNANPAAEGFSSDLRLRLPAEQLDGRSPARFDSLVTTLGVKAQTPRWDGRFRILPGSAEMSLLHYLIRTRDPQNPKDQMPPIASRVVDEEGIELVGSWIDSITILGL